MPVGIPVGVPESHFLITAPKSGHRCAPGSTLEVTWHIAGSVAVPSDGKVRVRLNDGDQNVFDEEVLASVLRTQIPIPPDEDARGRYQLTVDPLFDRAFPDPQAPVTVVVA